MKRLIRRAVLLLAMGMLLLCCTGCVTGQIYGKPIDDMEDVDKAQGIMFGEKIMEIMNDGTLEELNELGYHNGQSDAVTFEEFWASWEEFRKTTGKVQDWSLYENVLYGSELVFTYEMTMENGNMRLVNMFTADMDLVMLDLYVSPDQALESTKMPEGIVEEDVVLEIEGGYPVNGKLTYPAGAKAGDDLKAVVLVSAEGANNIDYSAKNVYMYRDMAWGLAQKGIASVRFEKSTLVYQDELEMVDCPADMQTVAFEYTDHTLAATELLRGLDFVNAEQVYYAGSGQGGVVAPRADEIADYAGIIMLSTSPRPYYDVIYDQRINYGLIDRSDEEIYYLVSRTEAERDYLEDGDHLDVEEEDLMQDVIFGRTTAFWVDFLEIDCAEYLKEVQKPVLILQGENDYMITMDADYSVWQEEMEDESYATLKSYEGLSFFMTESKGIFSGHYMEFDRPARVSETVIEDVATWMLNEGTLAE